METETVVPQKRKVAAANDGAASSTPTDDVESSGATDAQPTKNEYENGHITCEACGEEISFRDEATGGFTVKHWDLHRQQCPNASQPITVSEPVMYTPESHGEPSAPTAKRRRAKRSEEERIEYLRSDPYVAQFEAYRVLCASCDKWIRLRPNSTYCSIPWDAHRKSCLAKKSKNVNSGDQRSNAFANDPYVRKFDAERVLCKLCETWLSLGTNDTPQAVQTWMDHKLKCLQTKNASSSNAGPSTSVPTIESVPPPSKHLMALVTSSAMLSPPLPQQSPTASTKGPLSTSSTPKVSSSSFKDLNPTNFPPTQESRRRNAEQRAAALRADTLITQVEPNRVFCSLCKKWVQLRQDSSYCAYPWMQHRGKCVKRQQKRAQKEAELAEYRAQMEALQREKRKMEEGLDDSEDPESEEGADSQDEEAKRRRAERRAEKVRAKKAAKAAELRRMEERKALLNQKAAAVMNESDGDEDAEGEIDVDYEDFPPHFANLETPAGRLDFTHRSIRYLFRTTYDRGDDLTIASLVTYLNAAIPADKHEDFDTTEVTKAATALHERGDILFEGDVVRMLDD